MFEFQRWYTHTFKELILFIEISDCWKVLYLLKSVLYFIANTLTKVKDLLEFKCTVCYIDIFLFIVLNLGLLLFQ